MSRFAVLSLLAHSLTWPLVRGQDTCASDDVEVQETDDFGLLQIKPMHKKSKKVLVWCTAGGGLRALAVAQGYASAFSRAGFFKRKDLTALGANSGGTWWLSQFAYDEDYFRKNLQCDRVQFQGWLQDVWNSTLESVGPAPNYTDFQSFEAPGQWVLYLWGVAQALGFSTGLGTLLAGVLVTHKHNYSWRSLVQALFQKQAVGQKRADLANRPVLQRPSLHFAITGLAHHFIQQSPVSQRVAWQLAADKSALALEGDRNSAFVPMQWVVPGRCRKFPNGTRVAKMVMPPKSAVDWEARLMGLDDSFIPTGDFKEVREPTAVGALTVEQVAAMSSAALSSIASPLAFQQILKFFSGDNFRYQALLDHVATPFGNFTIGQFFQGQTPRFGLEKMAVCGSPENDLDDCQYPSKMFGDGGQLDNIAVALTIADLQQHHCPTTTLRMVLTDNGQGDRNTPQFPTLKQLFSVAGAASPGSFVPRPFDGAVVTNAQVFAATWFDIEWQQLKTTLGAGTVEYATLTTTTVDNPSYGVQLGQHVELLLFYTRTPSDLLFGTSSSYVNSALLTSDKLVTNTLRSWLHGGAVTEE